MKTDPASQYVVEALGEQHDRKHFSCGSPALDRYFRQQAGQDARRQIAVPFVLVHRESKQIAGFYTLASAAIELTNLPPDLAKQLPKYPHVPATLLGRLAVDSNHRGKGLGEFLLLDALRRSWDASHEIASFAVLIDAKDESACAFYKKYGFIPFPDKPQRLFLPMKTACALFG